MMNGKKVKPQRFTETHGVAQRFFVYLCVFSAYLCGLTLKAQDFEAAMAKQGLVDVQKADPTILVELKYSTTDNFVGKDVYGDLTRAYMQPMAAEKLTKASKYLQAHHPNLRLLVYDAARPRSAQWKLWNALPELSENERRKYVADPRIGSIHNYGCAVDLTVATADGKALDMGTKYDFFGELAYPSREKQLLQSGKLTRQQIDNRQILRTAMRQGGFTPIEYEWWHFNSLSREKAKMMFRIVD
ncbi:D-alanyl-D-alanine dipeptidase [Spirosoma fluviale]|uniref:D-alanyl-D-alanine dipeptidase n=2 Tax=Spirosoma fluviale TaxID=1597977 RepID=A0A286G8N6_9BACT|nr:D-alanyl-D-alanine dipeptidase [Spirosoma fluviale]